MAFELTAERVNELLIYNPDTGVFTRRIGRGGTKGIGSVAGTLNSKGHRQITIDGRKYLAHRLAWLVSHGYTPIEEIDHINMIKDDNRIVNLREASHSENQHNRGAYANNTSGFKGVYWCKSTQKWRARIRLHGKNKHLGLYTNPEAAHAAYCVAADNLHGTFANHGSI